MDIAPYGREVAPAASNKTALDAFCISVEPISDLAQVVVRSQRGDAGAQQQLYGMCRQRVYRLVTRMVGNTDAADVTQQVFLQLLLKIEQFGGQSRFETWLFRLTVNECLQFLRKKGRRPSTTLKIDPVDRSAGQDRMADSRELLELALAQLDPTLRAIFLFRERENLSYAEIAKTLEISEGTVASRLSRARRQLQQILTELGWEP